MAEAVVDSIVCRVDIVRRAFGVVGTGDEYFASLWMHGDPLGPIHFRRADPIGRRARSYQHVGLIGKSFVRSEAIFAVGQVQSIAAAVAVELGDVKRAVIEQISIGLGIARVNAIAADEFVEVFETLVVAPVNGDSAIRCQARRRAFMFNATQCGALDRRRSRIERIDLDDPTKAIHFVRLFRARSRCPRS